MKKCIFCANNRLYKKSETQYYCTSCHKTWSEQKYQRDIFIIDAFIHNQSILNCSQRYSLSYNTVKHVYHTIRVLILNYTQEIYTQQHGSFSQYDEYYYLPCSKQKTVQSIFDAVGILGMYYESSNWVYTLLLPDQLSTMKTLYDHESADVSEHEAYLRFLQHHKVAYVDHLEHRLNEFWSYLEEFMCHFKGIQKENFIYYLKEAEFKFNHSKENQKKIILSLWSHYM